MLYSLRALHIFKIIKSSDEIKFPVHSIYSGVTGICENAMIPCSSCIPIQNDVPITWNVGPLSIIQGHCIQHGLVIKFVSALLQTPPKKMVLSNRELIFNGLMLSYLITYIINLI